MKDNKRFLIIGGLLLGVLLLIWAFKPDYLFNINIHATYYLFGMKTIIVAYLALLLLSFGGRTLSRRLRNTNN